MKPPKIEWRMIEKRHHKGYVNGRARFRIEPNRVFPKILEFWDRGMGCVIKNTAEGKRLADQIIKREIALVAEKLLPREVQLKIANAIAVAAAEAAEAVKKAASGPHGVPDEEAIEMFVHNATWHAIGGLEAAGLLSTEGIKA